MPLTPEERNDLRKRVLQGYSMSLDEAREVLESLRTAQGAAMLEAASKPKGARAKRPATTDEQLDSELDALGL